MSFSITNISPAAVGATSSRVKGWARAGNPPKVESRSGANSLAEISPTTLIIRLSRPRRRATKSLRSRAVIRLMLAGVPSAGRP